ncbi:MAG: hypothetical protein JKY56_19030 [Kofleriaceae bacterium]|nr:hypothetical protein [Kofleriaceae bacterium]
MMASAGKQDGELVLVVHPSARVRGAIHRGLSSSDELSVVLCASVQEAQKQAEQKLPSVALIRFDEEALEWGLSLYSRQLVPVVFTFVRGENMARSADARALGLVHFVELPRDNPAGWACQSERLESTMLRAIEVNQARRDKFARATTIQPAISRDLVASMVPEFCPEPSSTNAQGQTSVLMAITKQELMEHCSPKFDERVDRLSVPTQASASNPSPQKLVKARKRKKRRTKKKAV